MSDDFLMVDAKRFPLPNGQGVVIGYDAVGVPAGIVAYNAGRMVEVRLDVVQLRAFAEHILSCAQPSCSRM